MASVACPSLTGMLLAELEVFHSRPIAPTRRVSLGNALLPCDPAPGVGGVLLGAIAARFTPELEADFVPDLVALTHEVEAGRRIAQPRLRHRLQDDRIGLTRSVHRLFRHEPDDALHVTFTDDKGQAGQMVLGAIYATQGLPSDQRGAVLAAIRRGIAWKSDVNPALFLHLSGRGAGSLSGDALADPVGWAKKMLGFGVDDDMPGRSLIQRSFRERLIDAHPDHGGDDADAAKLIADITEARRILLAK